MIPSKDLKLATTAGNDQADQAQSDKDTPNISGDV